MKTNLRSLSRLFTIPGIFAGAALLLGGLNNQINAQTIDIGRPVLCADVEASFSRTLSKHSVVIGNRSLTIVERGLLGKQKRQVSLYRKQACQLKSIADRVYRQ